MLLYLKLEICARCDDVKRIFLAFKQQCTMRLSSRYAIPVATWRIMFVTWFMGKKWIIFQKYVQ